MKKIIFILSLAISSFAFSQVSTTRINDIKLGMKQSELEKVINKKIKIPLDEYGNPSNFKLAHNGVTYTLYFWQIENDFQVGSITANDSSLKTLSGIKKGSTLDELWSKYKNYNIKIYQGWEDDSASKRQRYFIVEDYDAGSALSIELNDNKVVGFSVSYNEGC